MSGRRGRKPGFKMSKESRAKLKASWKSRRSHREIRTGKEIRIGDLLYYMRDNRGLSQREMNDGLSGNYAKYESHKATPTIPTMKKICKTLGIPMWHFFKRYEQVRAGLVDLDGKAIVKTISRGLDAEV